jgi:lipooligosaccharide transport system ATP-binding protein
MSDPALRAAMVTARGLCKRYDDTDVVDHVDLEVRAGECWGLLGPNGAGKTTLLKMIIGRTPPSAGDLRVLGLAIPGAEVDVRARIGVVPQQDTLDPDFTVAENLRIYGGYFGLDGAEMDRRLPWLMRFASLEGREGAQVNTLSGGMQRRLSISRALVNAPDLVILDEPTTGLDPQARQLIWQRLRALRRDGLTLILTSHYMEEAQRLCDRVTVMDRGRMLACDTPRDLIRAQVEPQVVEVHGDGLAQWHREHGSVHALRHELVGETGLYYAQDPAALLASLDDDRLAEGELSFLHRPANLEDVFVRLTGRELRDD